MWHDFCTSIPSSLSSAPALATGNTIIIKPSEDTSLVALQLGERFMEADFPDGVAIYEEFVARLAEMTRSVKLGLDLFTRTKSVIINFT